MTERITASDLYSHLVCPHRVSMDAFADPALRDDVSPFVQMLWERGTAFEREAVQRIGGAVLDLSNLRGEQKEAATRAAMARQEPLIYAGRLSVDELLGEPDLLRYENGGYAAIDIKSGASEAGGADDDDDEGKPKKSYGVQIALYTDILMRLGVSAGRYGYIWDVHGEERRYDLDTPLGLRSSSLWETYLEARAAVAQTLAGAKSLAAASSACKQCVWRSACIRVLKETRDLTLLPELGRAKREALAAEFASVEDLAAANMERYRDGKSKTVFKGIGIATLKKFKARATLAATVDAKAYLSKPMQWPVAEVELFFDIETDPMRDLCYLHGFVLRERRDASTERFVGIYVDAPTPAAERKAFAQAMEIFRQFPTALIIHYSKYERTEYRGLQRKYPEVATAEEIEALFARPRALDLYFDVVKPGSEWPTLDFSIKSVAKYCGFRWRDADPSGASSIEWFDQWVKTADPALKQRLLNYNEDDCIAMRVVLDAMKGFAVKS